jgi:AbrB family looped-hinge helix DNA binding protein
MDKAKARIGEGGRIVIPAEIRRELGVGVGDELLLKVENGELRAWTRAQAIKRAQALLRKYVPEGVSLVDELIAERRREAALE